jgi:AcrR family transcriptional regulator
MGIQERKQRERERRRQAIMLAAKRVFTAKGYERSTMEDIAKEAELSPGTLYLYFKNKDALYASLTLRVLQYMTVRLEHALEDGSKSYEEKRKALIEAMFDIYEFDAVILNNMFHLQSSETLKELSADILDEINALSRKALRMITAVFAAGMEEGVIHQHHPTAVADIFWSMFTGAVLWEETKKLINPERYTLRETLDASFDILYRGLDIRERT